MYFAQSCLAMMEADSLIFPCQGHEPLPLLGWTLFQWRTCVFIWSFFPPDFYFDAGWIVHVSGYLHVSYWLICTLWCKCTIMESVFSFVWLSILEIKGKKRDHFRSLADQIWFLFSFLPLCVSLLFLQNVPPFKTAAILIIRYLSSFSVSLSMKIFTIYSLHFFKRQI